MNLDDLLAKKTLGITLNCQEDAFTFTVNIRPGSDTYCSILSDVCGLYDPLGFSTPITLPVIVLLQDICRLNPEWGEILPEEIVSGGEHGLPFYAI